MTSRPSAAAPDPGDAATETMGSTSTDGSHSTVVQNRRLRFGLSLIRDRWHWSSRIITGLTLLALVFCNVPGQLVLVLRYEVGFPFYLDGRFEHGWPFTYLTRNNVSGEQPGSSDVLLHRCFDMARDVESFQPWALLIDVCVVIALSVAVGVAFEAWRRQRRRLWHLHVRDILVATVMVSLVAAWFVRQQQRYDAEIAFFLPADDADAGAYVQSAQPGGITWLRACLWEKAAAFITLLDHPFAITIEDSRGWSRLRPLPEVRSVKIEMLSTTGQLVRLTELPRLEAIEIDDLFNHDTTAGEEGAELPPLPTVRGLFLSVPARWCRRLDRLAGLEALRITEDCVDDVALQEISRLPNLRQLSLNGLAPSHDLSFLPSLSRLEALDFYNSELTSAQLRDISGCLGVTDLSLYMCKLDGSGVRHLSALTNLERLELHYTDVTSADLAELTTLKRLRELDLTRTRVGGDLRFLSAMENLEVLQLYDTDVKGNDLGPLVGLKALRNLDLGYTPVGKQGLEHLVQIKQLRFLRVSGFNEEQLTALRKALPDCGIDEH